MRPSPRDPTGFTVLRRPHNAQSGQNELLCLNRFFAFEVDLQEALTSAQLQAAVGDPSSEQFQRAFKEQRQHAEAAVEEMMEKSRQLYGQHLTDNLARMDQLRHAHENEMNEAVAEVKAALAEQHGLWLNALVREADAHAEAQGKLQALEDQQALAVAVSCLEAAAQQYYHDAAADEKERAELESLSLAEQDEQLERFHEGVEDNLKMLKIAIEDEFHRCSVALKTKLQQHQEACTKARRNILEAHRQLLEHHKVSLCLAWSLRFLSPDRHCGADKCIPMPIWRILISTTGCCWLSFSPWNLILTSLAKRSAQPVACM